MSCLLLACLFALVALLLIHELLWRLSRLFVRLYTRKARFYQQTSLDYSEIGTPDVIADACAELESSGMATTIRSTSRDTLETALGCLARSQLAQLVRQCGAAAGTAGANRRGGTATRDALQQRVVEAAARPCQQRTLDGRVQLFSDLDALLALPLVKLDAAARRAFDVLFGAHTLQWQGAFRQMLLGDLSIHRYPQVELDTTTVVFPTREAYNSLSTAQTLRSQFEDLAGEGAEATAAQIGFAMLAAARLVAIVRDNKALCLPVPFTADFLSEAAGLPPDDDGGGDEDVDEESVVRRYVAGLGPEEAMERCVPEPLRRMTPGHVYHRVVSQGVAVLERQKRFGDAVLLLVLLLSTVYGRASRGGWWQRLSIDLAHLGRPQDALAVARLALEDPNIAPESGDLLALRRRVVVLARPPPVFEPLFPQHREATITAERAQPSKGSRSGCKSVFVDPVTGTPQSVELVALAHYLASGRWTAGLHSENGVFRALFVLLLWDQVFDSSVPAAFLTPWQIAPLDVATDTFFASRQASLERRFGELAAATPQQLQHMVVESYERHRGTACFGVSWQRGTPLSALRSIAGCFPGRHLAVLFELMAKDMRAWAAGLPDLLLWRARDDDADDDDEKKDKDDKDDEDRGPRAMLVEVKGPGDRLSSKQEAWIGHMVRAGIDVEVCHVKDSSSSKGRGSGGRKRSHGTPPATSTETTEAETKRPRRRRARTNKK